MTDIDELRARHLVPFSPGLSLREEWPIAEPASFTVGTLRALLDELAALRSAQQCEEPDTYDAGLLGDGGGGDVDWWHTYIRHGLERAHEFYAAQFRSIVAPGQQWRGIESAPVRKDILCWGRDAGYGVANFPPNVIWAEYPEYTDWTEVPPPPLPATGADQ